MERGLQPYRFPRPSRRFTNSWSNGAVRIRCERILPHARRLPCRIAGAG